MPFVPLPLQSEPARSAELKLSKIAQEMKSIEQNILNLQNEIKIIKESTPKIIEKKPLEEPLMKRNIPNTSDLYKTNGKLPLRFEQPGN
jgi:hypothetical protein